MGLFFFIGRAQRIYRYTSPYSCQIARGGRYWLNQSWVKVTLIFFSNLMYDNNGVIGTDIEGMLTYNSCATFTSDDPDALYNLFSKRLGFMVLNFASWVNINGLYSLYFNSIFM